MDRLDETAFDFWIGEWDCTFDGGHAVNTITRDHQGAVLTERFVMDEPRTWHGMSVSVFNPVLDLWRQTWVDDDGSYWHFEGTIVEGDPCFATPERVDAEALFKRMIFSNITHERFDWRWESSTDGLNWTENWAITYSRR